MLKKVCFVALAAMLFLTTMAVPSSVVFGAERTAYSIKDAVSYKGTRNQNMNVYSSFMTAGAGAGAEFSIFVPAEKTYHIIVRASSSAAATITASINSESAPAVDVNTGSYANYEEIIANTVKLKAGYSRLAVITQSGMIQLSDVYIEEAPAQKPGADFSKTEGAFKSRILPAVIEAEDFDYRSAKSADKTVILSQKYRKDSVLSIEEDGSSTTLSMGNGDSAAYTFEVAKTGLCAIKAVDNTAGAARIYFDSGLGCVESELKSFAENSFGTVYLTEGIHKIRLESRSAGLSVDKLWFKHAQSSSDYYNPSELVKGKIITITEKEDHNTAENPVWKELYVSESGTSKGDGSKQNPFDSIETAKAAVRKLASGMQGDIVIHILPGTYFIGETITFTPEDSGKNGYNIVYKGTDPDNKPQLSGGKKIDGWQKAEGNIWSAKVGDDIDMVRQLYINEFPARIARSKYLYNGTRAYVDPMTEFEQDGFYIPKKNFPVLSRTGDVEFLFPFMWCLHHFPAKGIEDAGDEWLVKYDQPYYGRYLQGAASHSTPTAGIALYVSNAPELMDEPGEFYFDRKTKTVYYYAYEEEDMTKAEVYTPCTANLIKVQGSSKSDKVLNLTFDNLDIRLGSWNDIARTGLFTGQGDSKIPPDAENPTGTQTWWEDMVPAQMEMNFADNIAVTNCTFLNHGSTALAMRHNVTDSKVEGNVFRDLAGSAIVIGHEDYEKDVNTVEDLSRHISVNNNVIRRIGHDYMNSIGIMIFYANSIEVMHNDLKYLPYSGISVGWGWGSALSVSLKCGEHNIADNRIDYTSMAVYDGGSIYTLSEMKGMYIQGNYMSNSKDSGGIYFDQGSKSIVARDNVFENNQKNTFYSGNLIDTIYRNYANYVDYSDSRPWNGKAVTEKPIRTEGDNWGPEARAIMANAGLQQDYKALLNGEKIEHPRWRKMSIEVLNRDSFTSKTRFVIHASNWMDGGEGVAFHEINGEQPEDYGRKDSFIGNTYEGEWIKYKANIAVAGNYGIDIYYALQLGGGEANLTSSTAVTVYIDGVMLGETIPLEDTGSWNSYLAKTVGDIELSEGEHEIKVEFTKGAFAFGRLQFSNLDAPGSDLDYDDGVLFKLPE